MLGSLVGHVSQACKFQNNVLQLAEVVGVSSSLMALKDKGEGEGRVTYQDACGTDDVQSCILVL